MEVNVYIKRRIKTRQNVPVTLGELMFGFCGALGFWRYGAFGEATVRTGKLEATCMIDCKRHYAENLSRSQSWWSLV